VAGNDIITSKGTFGNKLTEEREIGETRGYGEAKA
jgi:hypothetical protein